MSIMKFPLLLAIALASAMLAPDAARAGEGPVMNMLQFTFSDLGGVKSWKKGSDSVVFIKNKTDNWYKAELTEPCMAYDTSKGVNFIVETDPTTNTRSNAVVVERRICRVTSLVKVASPEMPAAK